MFRRILLWFTGILVFSLVGFMLTNYWLALRSPMRDDMFRRLVDFQVAESVRTYESGGSTALAAFLDRLDKHFPAAHHRLLDQNNIDLVTGVDRTALVDQVDEAQFERKPGPRLPPGFAGPRGKPGRPFLLRRSSPDGRYTLLVEGTPRPEPFSNLAVYGWIVVMIVLLCYALAWTLAKPIRQLRETVVRFGKGDLDSRTASTRRDELGDLGRAFDQMADRISTLLTAERRLLQDISHELRSPLARLRFAVQLAKSNPTGFERVNKEVDRLSALVGELLQVTRAEGDLSSRDISEIPLKEFLYSLVDDCRIEAEVEQCSIRVFAGEEAVWRGDRELLHRAVENVLRNAIRHSPEGSNVDVDLTRQNGSLVIGVRDYGPGVPEDELEEIFRPFYRVEEDRSRDKGGVGLGLAIAQRAIRLHQGEIRAANANPGLRVELWLPA